LFTVASFTTTLHAQRAASITTTPQPVSGPAIFDAAGNLYYFGGSGPVTAGAAQTENGGGTCYVATGFIGPVPVPCPDAYVAKLDTSGNLVFGTYLGGPTADQANAVAVDGAGNVFFTGSTGGSFPTTANAAIATSTTAKTFAAKLSADGSRILYSTYLPDTAATATAIAIDAQDNAYVVGKSGTGHAYVVKLSADGSTFLYYISLAGTNQDAADAILADVGGNVVVAGHTSSPDFPTSPGVVQSRLPGMQNVFVAKLNSSGSIVFSTYLGGSGTDTPTAVRTDSAGNIYVAGETSSLDFPTTAGSFQPIPVVPLWNNGGPGGFIAKFTADGSALAWSSYVMSMDSDLQRGVAQLAVTPSGDAYFAGLAGAGFAVTASAPQICFGGPSGNANVFLAHLDAHGVLLDATYIGQNTNFAWGLSLAGDGSVLLVWHSSGNNVKSQIRFGGPGSSAPACLSASVLNSATMSGNSVVVPGELITLTGFGIGPDLGVAYQPDAQGQVPRQLAGVQVLFDGQPAPVLYAQSRQVNALAPIELSGKTQTNITVAYNNLTLGSIAASVSAFGSPGIFRFQPGASSQAAAMNQDGTLNSPSNPAARGSVVAVWGTGFGITDPPCATGSLNAPGPVNLAVGLSAELFDGRVVPAQYAGGAPALLCGVEQINFLVPAYAKPGVYQFLPWSVMALNGGQAGSEGTIGVTIFVK
jgi:uncharacterized protein (TIGR03437 family)